MNFKKTNNNSKIIFIPIVIFLLTTSELISEINHKNFGNEPIPKEITNDYFPLDTTLQLLYNTSFGEALSVIKKTDNGYILDIRNDDFYFVQTVEVMNDTVYLKNLDENVDVFLFISAGVKVSYEQPSVRFPFPLTLNESWLWKGVELIDGANPDTITVSGKVIDKEILETEAGNFDCIKFQIDINKKKSGSHTKFYEWRTPKIGLVKLEAYIDSKGFIGTIMDLLGYDKMDLTLKKIL